MNTQFLSVILALCCFLSSQQLVCMISWSERDNPNHAQIGQEVAARIIKGGDMNNDMEFASLVSPRPPLFGVLMSDQNNKVLKDLLERGVDVGRPWGGWLALCETIKAGAHQNLAVLVHHIKSTEQNPKTLVDAHMPSWIGSQTPLHYAAERCSCCVAILLQCGADPNTKDNRNVTPLETAIINHAKCNWVAAKADEWEPMQDILRILHLLKAAGADFSDFDSFVTREEHKIRWAFNKESASQMIKKFQEMIETFKQEND